MSSMYKINSIETIQIFLIKKDLRDIFRILLKAMQFRYGEKLQPYMKIENNDRDKVFLSLYRSTCGNSLLV